MGPRQAVFVLVAAIATFILLTSSSSDQAGQAKILAAFTLVLLCAHLLGAI